MAMAGTCGRTEKETGGVREKEGEGREEGKVRRKPSGGAGGGAIQGGVATSSQEESGESELREPPSAPPRRTAFYPPSTSSSYPAAHSCPIKPPDHRRPALLHHPHATPLLPWFFPNADLDQGHPGARRGRGRLPTAVCAASRLRPTRASSLFCL
ncbi:hypothetical protein CFC21_017061 [Triticum aestivum]|uniref:Uncharacterized protein n=2 Tax=Triticum aestivum TaxID=4565 RepID=A0A3B6AYM6_WHEAT|nr:hypothetical protein CFC21_017061 [Triticum aestivum]